VGQSWAARWRAEEDCRARNARNRAHRGLPALPELEPRPRALTPKQRLLAHIHTEHYRRPAPSMTLAQLREWHDDRHRHSAGGHSHEEQP
jgi:hypothetical protein